eukprot:Em0006g401a
MGSPVLPAPSPSHSAVAIAVGVAVPIAALCTLLVISTIAVMVARKINIYFSCHMTCGTEKGYRCSYMLLCGCGQT